MELNKYYIAFLIGYIFELVMTKYWFYPNVPYLIGVPIYIVLAWTFLLPLGYDLMNRLFKKGLCVIGRILYIFVTLAIIEHIGSWLGWKLSVASQYPSMFKACCNAPLWLYGLYFVMILGYWWYLDRRLK